MIFGNTTNDETIWQLCSLLAHGRLIHAVAYMETYYSTTRVSKDHSS